MLAISLAKGCDDCAAARATIAGTQSKPPADSRTALREGRSLPDAKLDALATLTRAMVDNRGTPSKAQVQAVRDAGCSERRVFGVILAIGVKTYSNYTNHMTGAEIDAVFARHRWPPDRRRLNNTGGGDGAPLSPERVMSKA